MRIRIKKKILEVLRESELIEDLNDEHLEEQLLNVDINSIQYIKIIVAVEAEFDIEFDDDMLANRHFEDLDSIITYLEEQINAQKAAM